MVIQSWLGDNTIVAYCDLATLSREDLESMLIESLGIIATLSRRTQRNVLEILAARLDIDLNELTEVTEEEGEEAASETSSA